MFQDRRDSWIGMVLALSLALSMLGAGGLLHLTHHLPGDEETGAPWECSQCKIAENSIGDLAGPTVCFALSDAGEFLISWDEVDVPSAADLESASPRGPPVLT